MGRTDSDLKKEMGKRLRDARKAIGKTQVEIAMELGLDEGSYSRYETGTVNVPHRHMATLDKQFGISPDYIILGRRGSLHHDVQEALKRKDAEQRKAKKKDLS